MNSRWLRVGAVALFAVSMLATPRALHAQSQSAEANSAAIRQAVAQFIAAFNRHDAKGWAAPFLENGDFTNVYGLQVHGRKAIEARFVKLFSGHLKNAHRTATVKHIRFITPDVAAVDADWKLVELAGPNGSAGPVRRGMFTWVMVKRHGHWKFAVFYEFEFKPHKK